MMCKKCGIKTTNSNLELSVSNYMLIKNDLCTNGIFHYTLKFQKLHINLLVADKITLKQVRVSFFANYIYAQPLIQA